MWSNIFTGSGGVRTCMSLDGWGYYSACSRGRWIPRGSLAKGSSGEAREVLRDVTVSSPSGLVNAHWEDTNTSGWWWRGYTSIQPILCFCSFFVFFFFNWNKCCNSVAKLCPILCNPVDCSTPDSSVLHTQSLLKLMSIESVMPSNHLILCHPLLLLPSVFPSIRVFSSGSALPIRWPKYWRFSFSISPSNEHSGLISFRMDWLDLLAVQGTLKSLLQHDSSKASILRRSAFFTVQITSIHDHRKTHSLDGPLLTK